MTQSFFRLNADGTVHGVAQCTLEDAERNLAPGQYLRPFESRVDPRRQRFDKRRSKWVARRDVSELEDDPAFMRRTGYPDLREQVGVLMKIAAASLAGEPISSEIRAEFDALQERILETKAAHPKARP